MAGTQQNDSSPQEALKDKKICKYGRTDSVGSTDDSFLGSPINPQGQLSLGTQPHVLANIAGYFDILHKWSQIAQVDNTEKVES